MPTLTDELRASRARAVENALASGRMEGLEPTPGAVAIFQRFVDGELTLKEMGKAMDEYMDLEYGPIRLPRNKRS